MPTKRAESAQDCSLVQLSGAFEPYSSVGRQVTFLNVGTAALVRWSRSIIALRSAPDGRGLSGSILTEGKLAKLMYRSLYKQHPQIVTGFLRTILAGFTETIDAESNPYSEGGTEGSSRRPLWVPAHGPYQGFCGFSCRTSANLRAKSAAVMPKVLRRLVSAPSSINSLTVSV